MSITSFKILFFLLFFMMGIGQSQAASEFRLGVINERPEQPDDALKQYGKLHQYLERELSAKGHQPIELVIARSVDEMVTCINNREVDALIEGVMPTLAIKQRGAEIDPTLLIWRKGQREYHTVFFVRRDSAINTLEDLHGKTIVFEAPRSTSAFFVPKTELLAASLKLGAIEDTTLTADAVRYMFAGSELNQAYWVHRGRAASGAFNDGDWERVPEAIKDELKIIHHTRPILRWLFSFTPTIDPGVREAVVSTLLSAHTNELGEEALQQAEQIKMFERLTPSDQENLDYWANVLKSSQ